MITDLASNSRFDQRSSKALTEDIQAQFLLKSALNFARALIEAPKIDDIKEDWLGDYWAKVGSMPSLPLADVPGELRLLITDESGKIELNAIKGTSTPAASSGAETNVQTQADFWKNALLDIFERLGFVREQYSAEKKRTAGNIGFDASAQVAEIHDWIDKDKLPFRSATFSGEGSESKAREKLYYNRPLKSLSELALVPGMTLERVSRVAPFVKASGRTGASGKSVNVNTAPIEVLQALGFPDNQVLEIAEKRSILPITKEILDLLTEGNQQLKRATKVNSNNFSVYARVRMANTTKWLKARVSASGSGKKRTTKVLSTEIY